MMDESPTGKTGRVELSVVPLFPLPGVVLLPRAILPLHIFEERYKAMTADALAGDRQIAMALLRPGWEKNYHGSAPIEPVVCVGSILAHERLSDGTYNLLLQGMVRASVARELSVHPYRTAELSPLVEPTVLEIDLKDHRRQLSDIFSSGGFVQLPLRGKFLEMLSSSVATSDIADLIAFNLIDDVHIKQQILSEADPRRRAGRVVSVLQKLHILTKPTDGFFAGDASLN